MSLNFLFSDVRDQRKSKRGVHACLYVLQAGCYVLFDPSQREKETKRARELDVPKPFQLIHCTDPLGQKYEVCNFYLLIRLPSLKYLETMRILMQSLLNADHHKLDKICNAAISYVRFSKSK
jgi:hypothetical protein